MSLPHRYPFRWIEPNPSSSPSRRRALISAAGHGTRSGTLSPFMALEVLAQACALDAVSRSDKDDTAGGAATDGSTSPPNTTAPGMLAAIDGAQFAEALWQEPLKAGDALDVEMEETAKFGRLRKVHGRIRRRGVVVVEADLVLHAGA